MSEDEEYEDELPAISVDSSLRESGGAAGLVMPSARELAATRAREHSVQLELRALRHAHSAGAAARSDSSGSSEGDAVLAAAVGALRMPPDPPAAPAAGARCARAARLAAALARRLPPAEARALLEYERLLRCAPRARAAFAARLVAGVCDALSGGGEWDARALLATGAALLALCAGGGAGALRARRALHRLLDAHAAPDHVWALARLASAAAGEAAGAEGAVAAATLRGALADAARGGGGAARGADLLAALLLRRALAELLHCESACAEEARAGEAHEACADGAPELAALLRGAGARWPALAPRAQYACAALAGRALALAGAGAAGALLAPAPAGRRARLCPERLRAQVAAARLQLLFRAPAAPPAAPPAPPAAPRPVDAAAACSN